MGNPPLRLVTPLWKMTPWQRMAIIGGCIAFLLVMWAVGREWRENIRREQELRELKRQSEESIIKLHGRWLGH